MIDPPANPFVGLRPFRSDESLVFFGRRQQTTELLSALSTTHFLAVIGSSGCGKSSLIQAGLIPRLTAGILVEERELWTFRTLTPGSAPRARLAALFDLDARALAEAGASAIVERLSTLPDAASRNCLLLVDQFEEIFSAIDTTARRDEAADFVAILLALAAQRRGPIFVVLTMRSDFLGDCDMFYGLPEAINQSHYLVPRLTRDSRREVVEGPIRLFGGSVTEQLVDRVLNDLRDDQDQLPVMQHALLRTWECWQRSGDGGAVELSHYLAAGGAGAALSRDAEAALADIADAERHVAVRLFQALTDTDQNSRPVRRYVRLSNLERETGAARDAIQRVVQQFREGGRSFVIVRDEPGSDDPIIYVSHESLIRQWNTLAGWVEQERDSRDQYLRLADLARRHARGEEGLLRDPALQLALDWRARVKPTAGWARRYRDAFAPAMTYLDASEAQREQDRLEREERHRHEIDAAKRQVRERWKSRLLKIAGGLIVVAFGTAMIAAVQWRSANRQAGAANRQALVAESSRLALLARIRADTQSDAAMLLGIRALELQDTFEARSGLLTLIGRNAHPFKFLHGHEQAVRAVAFRPTGTLAASGGDDGMVRLWDLESGQAAGTFEIGATVRALSFRPDGLLAAATNDKVHLWDKTTQRTLPPLSPGVEGLRSVAFSSDGGTLAAGAFAGDIVLWRLRTGAGTEDGLAAGPVAVMRDPGTASDVQAIAFGAAGALASAHSDGSILLWDVEHRVRTRKLTAEQGGDRGANGIAFDPRGRFVVSANEDRTITVWDLEARTPSASIRHRGHQARVQSVAISNDGSVIASASDDTTILLWDVEGGDAKALQVNRRPDPLEGHGSMVQTVAFSPEGSKLISGGWDNKVILWDLAAESLLEARFQARDRQAIESVAWTPDGTSVFLTRANGQIDRWNTGAGAQPVARLDASRGPVVALMVEPGGGLVRSEIRDGKFIVAHVDTDQSIGNPTELPDGADTLAVALSQDRQLLAYATRENEIVLWRRGESRVERTLDTDEWVYSLAFSPDTSLLASSWGQGLDLWRVASGERIDRFTDPEFLVSPTSTAFSADGRRFAVSLPTRILIWDVERRQLAGVLLTAAKNIRSIAFSPDGQRIAAGDGTGTVRVFNLGGETLKRAACRAANRELTAQEWSPLTGDHSEPRTTCGT